MEHIYDVLVIGGGPGGYSAALYATRSGLQTLVLEKMSAGGQMAQTEQIENYPGFDQGIIGYELGEKMQAGAKRFGAETRWTEVLSVELTGEIKRVETDAGTFLGRTVILATGAEHKHLGVAREEDFMGRGVAYCATCDGMFYRGKTVAVVGGGNTAVGDALYLSRLCEKVFLIHRRDSLRASRIYHDSLMKTENIEVRWNTTVESLLGEDQLTGLEVKDVQSGQVSEIRVDGLFVSVGQSPVTDLVRGQVELDDRGYIVADESTRTNLPGVFAVGDVRTKALRQVITAAADGAVAAYYAEEYLTKQG